MVNKVFLIGNTGSDPEVRSLESGVKVARIRLATTEKYNVAGERKEHTEWHNVILWRVQAEFAEKYIRKGTTLFIEGKIRSRERTDENGSKRTNYEIHADEVRIVRQPDTYRNQPARTEIAEEENVAPAGSDGVPF